jgi:acetoacetate decarboxylase
MRSLNEPGFLLKIIPHVSGDPRVCELVRFQFIGISLRGAWTGRATLDLLPHAVAPIGSLPVVEVISGVHLIADLTLDMGVVVHDYLDPMLPR